MLAIGALLSSASLLGFALALPIPDVGLPVSTEALSPTGMSDELEPDDDILEANKDADVFLVDGDILAIKARNAITCPNGQCLWPHSSDGLVRVPYVLDDVYGAAQKAKVSAAMQDIATMTCVTFVPRLVERDYLHIFSGTGCWSPYGKQGGAQITSLAAGRCLKQGTIQHELMHNLGFYHEHTRKDRDTYINIMWQYIDQGQWPNLDKNINANTLDLPYDYSSVMHYSKTAYSNTPGKSTLVPKPDPTVPIGQRAGISNLDVAKINALYNCGLCRTVLMNPRGTISFTPSTSLPRGASSCMWLIRLPGNQVFLWLSEFNITPSVDCKSNYLRVYDGNSKTSPVILDNTCGQGKGLSLLASGNTMLLEVVYSSPSALNSFNATYTTGSCQGKYTSTNGTVTSPNYPNMYPPSTACSWTIVAPLGYKVSLTLVSIVFAPQKNCMDHSLKIYDDSKPLSAQLGVYCQQSRTNITSYGNKLRLVFNSHHFTANSGFVLTYSFIANLATYRRISNIGGIMAPTTSASDKPTADPSPTTAGQTDVSTSEPATESIASTVFTYQNQMFDYKDYPEY
ncbi:astacin-like metalloendopeptidase [Pleurodeles waltl]|uniref:astacin-like metalloendopeptidase n=1 Tax=Pleurodeles waltl TaxID=8319 RepID=UPI003709C5BB